ncbi:RTC4-like domain-containing protein [Aspergillus ambiguus]|uniref:RTC4 family protein n=1 Tax=Aspergillus ambiguus TaxID=176160 RepID=UPI003CCDBFA1
MATAQRRDPSYASIRLTRRNGPEKSLHSVFGDKTPAKPEPATDDEPLSSEEDVESNARSSPGLRDDRSPSLPKMTLEEKLLKSSQDNGAAEGGKSNTKGAVRRKRDSAGLGQVESDEDDSFREMWSSQSVKRTFQSRNRGFGRTSSGLAPSQTKSPSPDSDRRKKKKKSSPRKNKSKSDKAPASPNGFKVPMVIDIPSPVKPTPQFKMPSYPDATSSSSFATSSAQIFDDDSGPGTPLSSLASSVVDALDNMSDTAEDLIPADQALCPWCKEPVDPRALMRFQAQSKQRIREQQRFCESHKTGSAEKEWREKGYPEIDWEGFDERIKRHFDDIESILLPDSTSYYRNILDESLKSGQTTNFRLTLDGDGLETISCGYYGTRGAAKMLHGLTDRFSRTLRRLAAEDHIVKKIGVVGYAQHVLVPELATRLVKEDMGVNDESARMILRQSIDIGEKLNHALNDKVPIPVEA